jgi:hypothetical protein
MRDYEPSGDARIAALFLIYSYHLRRVHHRADEVKIKQEPVLRPPIIQPPPIAPDVVFTFGLEEEKAREEKRFLFVSHLRVYATQNINWSHEDKKRALSDLETKWKSLDKYSQRDLESLYANFKHDCGPI